MTRQELAASIDHTNLKATATTKDIERLCAEARENGFKSVCVNSVWVPAAARLLEGSGVEVCTVVGFPLGAMTHRAKAFETRCAVEDGAGEIDMVVDVGAVKEGRFDDVKADIAGVVHEAKHSGLRAAVVKVILENCYLTQAEIETCSLLCVEAGADFVKTSTGFGTGGAKVEDVRLMAKTVAGRAQVKAAGGIRDTETALAMIEAGASRLGCSAGVQIIEGL